MAENIWIIAIIGLIGACVGSFITAASWRLPREENVVSGHSRCPSCKTNLKPLDLLPIFSWIISGGKCRHCGVKVSIRYVLTEVITAALFIWLYLTYGFEYKFFIYAALGSALLIMIIADFETYIMPDSTTIAALILAIAFHALYTIDWAPYIIGAVACLAVALGLKYGFYLVTKRDGLGFGDIKFLPVAGLWIGFEALPLYFVMSGVIGILTGVVWKIAFKKDEYPFGPALAIAMYILILWPGLNSLILQLK